MSSLVIASESSLTTIDISNGNLVKSYKACENVDEGLAIVLNRSHQPSILAVQRNKPLFHLYNINKEAVSKRLVLGAKFNVIAVSPNNQWLAGGSKDGSIYVWNLESGALRTHNSEAHFQEITSLSWSADSSVLVSGGADARILVWRLIDLVSSQQLSGKLEPKHTFTNHTLGITQLIVGAGNFRECRLYTASLDATCCVFDIFSGRLLYTLVSDNRINSLALDPAERQIYLGCDDGIHLVPLYVEGQQAKLGAVGSIDGTVVSTNTIEKICKPSGSTKCTALAISPDGSFIYAGMEDGSVSSWETGSAQLAQKFRSSKGHITQLIPLTETKSSIPSSQQQQNNQQKAGQDDFVLLQRNLEGNEIMDYIPQAPHAEPSDYNDDETSQSIESEFKDISKFTNVSVQQTPANTEEQDAKSAELEELKERHAKLQKMYDALWAKRK